MLIGVVSDIHSNLLALEATLADMGRVDELWCLGDLVGYGPWPNECIDSLRAHGVKAIAGNHDLAAVGAIPHDEFAGDAAYAAAWTASELRPDNRTYLASLAPMTEIDGVTLAHASPREPVWEYVLSAAVAAAGFKAFSTPLCLVGHTHVPSIFVRQTGGVAPSYMPADSAFALRSDRCIANPGSVGQPRDRDPRAAYLVYDTIDAELRWRRVAYDVAAVQARMRRAGLPRFLSDRLEVGV